MSRNYDQRRGPPNSSRSRAAVEYGDVNTNSQYDSRRQPPAYDSRREYSRRRSRSPDRRRSTYDDGRRTDRSYGSSYQSDTRQDHRSNARYPPPPRRDRERDVPAPREEQQDVSDRRQNDRSETARASAASSNIIKDATDPPQIKVQAADDVDPDEQAMMQAMGFGGFGTTKGQKVTGNEQGYAEVRKEHTWRQYMQRKGGFNRPLSPVRD